MSIDNVIDSSTASVEEEMSIDSLHKDDESMNIDDNVSSDDNVDATLKARPKNICIFCNKYYKRYNNRNIPLSSTKNYTTFDKVRSYATKWNDVDLLKVIDDKISLGSEICYHKFCKNCYNINSQTKSKSKTQWHSTRNHHKIAFGKLCIFIDQFIIQNKQFCYVNLATDIYKNFLVESYNDVNVKKDMFCARKIPQKLLKQFKQKIKIIAKPNVPKVIVSTDCDVTINMDGISASDVVLRAAMILRNEVRQLHRKPIGDNVTVDDLLVGECSMPPYLTNFYTTLLAGFNYRRRKNARTGRLVKSFGSDVIYSISNGSIKTSKHICLASSVKTMTNSKKLFTNMVLYAAMN